VISKGEGEMREGARERDRERREKVISKGEGEMREGEREREQP
jgi:hypothetical protein